MDTLSEVQKRNKELRDKIRIIKESQEDFKKIESERKRLEKENKDLQWALKHPRVLRTGQRVSSSTSRFITKPRPGLKKAGVGFARGFVKFAKAVEASERSRNTPKRVTRKKVKRKKVTRRKTTRRKKR